MQDTNRLKAGEERLKDLLLRGLAGDATAYQAFLRDLSAHLRAFLRKRLARERRDAESERLVLIPRCACRAILGSRTGSG